MPDRDELDLSALSRTPVGALPGACAARARGDQRTRRTRAALAGGGALVALLALTAGAALGGGGADRIEPAPFADPTPSSSSSSAQEEGLAVSLLDPSDVSAVRGEPWELRRTYDLPFEPLPAGCGDASVFGSPAATALRFLNGPDSLVVGQALKGYADEQQAQAAFGRVIDAIEACGDSRLQLQGGISGSGPSRSYGTFALDPSRDTVVFAIERIGVVLSGVSIRSFELEDVPPLADAAREEVAGGPFAAPDPADVAGPPSASTGLLRPGDMATVEPGTWTEQPLADGALLAPCEGRTEYPRQLDMAGTDLRTQREQIGTSVYQQVFRYSSPSVVSEALAAHRTAVEVCPEEPIEDIGDVDSEREILGTTSYERVEAPGDALVVRVTFRCGACDDGASYAVVLQESETLTVLRVVSSQPGGVSLGLALQYADLARERLRQATG